MSAEIVDLFVKSLGPAGFVGLILWLWVKREQKRADDIFAKYEAMSAKLQDEFIPMLEKIADASQKTSFHLEDEKRAKQIESLMRNTKPKEDYYE